MATEVISTHCCIVGGGPCELMLGFLLARAGIDIVVLEKHEDFLRDFRGDTIHPSTMEVMFRRSAARIPQAAAPEGGYYCRALRQPELCSRGFSSPTDARQVPCTDAAMEFPEFSR